MKKHTETFTAVDANNNKYQIDVYQTFIKSESLDGTSITPGLKDYRIGKDPIRRIDDNTFQTQSTNTQLKKVG
jgi:hypothetical protein